MLAAAWVTGAATVGLLIGAVVTAFYAARAFRMQRREFGEAQKKNSAEIQFLQLQTNQIRASLEEMGRLAAARRRAQASRVYVWQEAVPADPRTTPNQAWDEELAQAGPKPKPWFAVAHIRNDSDQPVYDVRVKWFEDSSAKSINHGRPLRPGEAIWETRPMAKGDLPAGFELTIYFRDAAGVIWRAHPDGRHEELPPDDKFCADESLI